MSKVEVLFFAADPLSADGYQRRVLLDEEVRQIREKVRAARHRDDLEFDTRWATRTDDLLQALNESQPDIVHFSGHGGSKGLVLVSADGLRSHHVDGAALHRLFNVFRGKIRVVVLNACTSLPQAQAIADAVGCAIGTPAKISDTAAIAFGASFYRAIAFGQSVQAAFDQACTALMLENFEEGEHPVLVTREDVDASELIFISQDAPVPLLDGTDSGPAEPPSPPVSVDVVNEIPTVTPRGLNRVSLLVATLALSTGAVIAYASKPPAAPPAGSPCARAAEVLSVLRQANEAERSANAKPALLLSAVDPMERAEALYHAGNYTEAFPLFKQAAVAGNEEAMGYVGEAYLDGLGTPPNWDSAGVWLATARETRDPRAMNALGEQYKRGFGVQRRYNTAVDWFQNSADAQFPEAMRNLAEMYRDGLSVEENGELALQYYEKAAKAGLLQAMNDAAEMFARGQAVARDPEAARCWNDAAAEARSLR